MKRILFCLIAMPVAFVLVTSANAALITRGTGISTHGTFNLIYDTDLDLTWYDFTNAGDLWNNQADWAGALSVDFGGDTYDDWRLPSTVDGSTVWSYDGTTTYGYNVTNSEMGHLYYTELGNKGYFATDGTFPQPGWGLLNTGDFQNLIAASYWSGTAVAGSPGWYWNPMLADGGQLTFHWSGTFYGLAVRDGDVGVVPEPVTITLLGIGLVGLAGATARRRQKKVKYQ